MMIKRFVLVSALCLAAVVYAQYEDDMSGYFDSDPFSGIGEQPAPSDQNSGYGPDGSNYGDNAGDHQSTGGYQSAGSDQDQHIDDSEGGGDDPFTKPKRDLSSVSLRQGAMSVGGGLFFGSDFGGGVKYDGGVQALARAERVMPVYGFGLHTFFDHPYVTAGLSFYWGGGKWNVAGNEEWETAVMSVNIDALGKYPMPIDDKMTAFPLLGFAYHIVATGKTKTGNSQTGVKPEMEFDGTGSLPKAIDLSALWIKFGGGLDYAVTESIYARGELMYGVRLANGYENNYLTNGDKLQDGGNGTTRLGHGLTLRAGLGYYF